jgi:hypothetical protein
MSQIPFQDIPTSQKVPSSSKVLELLGKSDLVKERYTTSQQPYSGQGAGIGAGRNSRITYKIFNNSDYADLATAYITFNAKFENANPALLNHLQAEDNVLSWFNLVRVMVNDQILEEISNFNVWANLITYASMSRSYYETAGSFMGCYRHSKFLHGGPAGVIVHGATPAPLDFGAQAGGQQMWEQLDEGVAWIPANGASNVPFYGSGGNDTWASAALQSSGVQRATGPNAGTQLANNGYSYAMPLAGYLGLFSITKYFPLRSVSSITLELNLSTNPASVIFDNLLPPAGGAPQAAAIAAVSSTSLQLNNLNLHLDMVRMADEYYSIMDSELLDPNGLGVQYVINTVECTPVNIPIAPVGGGPAKRVLLASKGTRFLKSLWCAQIPTLAINSSIAPPSSVFTQAGFSSCQLVCNSRRFPQFPIDNLPRAYEELSKSCGKYHSIVGDSIITYPKYALDLTAGATSLNSAVDSRCEYATFFIGFNLDQVLDAPEIDLQGENTLTAGFQLQLELTSAPPVEHQAFIFPHFSKVLRIKGGAISILN